MMNSQSKSNIGMLLSVKKIEKYGEGFSGYRPTSSDRLVAIGKGASVPIATNDDEAGRKINRRVEIVFLK